MFYYYLGVLDIFCSLYINMNLVVAIYSAILFFVLSPGVLLRLPSNGSKLTVAGVHALVFAVILYFTAGYIWRFSMSLSHPVTRKEGMEGSEEKKKNSESASY
jgi:hypothetical protein